MNLLIQSGSLEREHKSFDSDQIQLWPDCPTWYAHINIASFLSI